MQIKLVLHWNNEIVTPRMNEHSWGVDMYMVANISGCKKWQLAAAEATTSFLSKRVKNERITNGKKIV